MALALWENREDGWHRHAATVADEPPEVQMRAEAAVWPPWHETAQTRATTGNDLLHDE
ncbi:MAG: hypothetical protein AB7E81_10475 [Hyphomicrobiaceae bacterium]